MSRFLVAIIVLTTACASSAPAPVSTPAPVAKALAYAAAPATASYAFSDTSGFRIQSGAMGEISASISDNGIADVSFEPAGTDVTATIRITSFSGASTNSAMGGGPVVSEKEIEGPAVVKLNARGVPTIVSMPKLTQSAQRVGMSEGFFRRFFVRLPAAPVAPGTTWVDTISTTDESAGIKAAVNDIATSTFVGDSTINGRSVAVILISTQRKLQITGSNEGVEITQKLSGTATGRALWDREHSLLVERTENTSLTGTFDMPQMNMAAMPITARSNGRITLR